MSKRATVAISFTKREEKSLFLPLSHLQESWRRFLISPEVVRQCLKAAIIFWPTAGIYAPAIGTKQYKPSC